MVDKKFAPTDEELALFTKLGQEAIEKFKQRAIRKANEWKGLDHPLAEYSYEYKGYGHLSRPFFIEGNLYSSSPDSKKD